MNKAGVRLGNNPRIMLGSSLEMNFETESPVHQRIAREEQGRFFGVFAGTRVLGTPLLAALLVGVAWFEPISWRSGVLFCMAAVLPTFFWIELRRFKKFGFDPSTIPRNMVLSALGQLTVSAGTGGLWSPVIFGVIPIAGLVATLMDRRHQRWIVAGQITVLFVFAALASRGTEGFASPGLVATPTLLPWTYYFVDATLLSLVTLAVVRVSHLLREAFGSTFRRATHAQNELLESHAARVKELTALSAEIAHELKNPLASIKGLSALLVQNVSDDRGNERLRVLRREVDRMQTVLEEFLNFSRPLVPLSLARREVRAIAEEVLSLHEGLARQKNVTLTLNGPTADASCDPNKVKQILINLVQNALDASPTGSEVLINIAADSTEVLLQVTDSGPGVNGDLGDVFLPGITSKSAGSGIGLTIARALARQHGGELTLSSSGEQSGACAELRLPRSPRAELSQAVA